MKKIIKYLVLLIVVGVVAGVIYKISDNNKNVKAGNHYSDTDGSVKIEKQSLKQIREMYSNDVEDLRNGEYDKLSTQNPYIYITEQDSVSNISEKSNHKFDNLSLMELLEAEYEVVKNLIGEDLNMDYLVDDTSMQYNNENYDIHYPTYQETVESIKNNTYTPNELTAATRPYLGYIGLTVEGGDQRYCHVPQDMDYVVFMRGKLFELTGEAHEDLESDFEPLKTYYNCGTNLEDKYMLSNGEISIKDAIDFVEQYFEDLHPYNIFPEIKNIVHHVSVFDIGNGIYAYEFTMVRKFDGLIAEAGTASGEEDNEVKDCTKVTMVETDNVDIRIGSGNGHEMSKIGEEITEVISLKSVLELISSKIGNNSQYEITEISMIFRRDVKERKLYQQEYTGIPHWLVRGKNLNDGREVRFYVNMADGKLEYK